MKIDLQFWGRGSAFNPVFGNTNAFFTLENDLYFLDFGESTFEKVFATLNMAQYRNIYVLITHLHADHAGSLASLCSYTHCVLQKHITIIHPVDTVLEMLRLQGISRTFYEYAKNLPADCPLKAEAVSVKHAPDMQSFGYLLQYEGERIYYSGDAAEMPEQIAQMIMEDELDRVYHDVASTPSASHCHMDTLIARFPLEKRARIYAMHLDCDFEAALRANGFSVVHALPRKA